jgi:uncharacterized protein (DUF427 family)
MPERNAAEDRAKILEKYPDYVITVRPAAKHIQVVAGGEIIADTDRALELDESYHQPVYYLPRGDVRMDALTPTAHETYCCTRATSSYWSIQTAKGMLENAVWSYQDPLPQVTGIHGFLAFYADKVDEIRVGEG